MPTIASERSFHAARSCFLLRPPRPANRLAPLLRTHARSVQRCGGPLVAAGSHGRQPSRSSGRRHTSTWPGRCALPWRERSPAAGALWPPGFARLVLAARRAPQRRRCQSTRSRATCTRGQPSTLLLGPSRGHHRVRAALLMLHHHSTAADEPPSAGNSKSGISSAVNSNQGPRAQI